MFIDKIKKHGISNSTKEHNEFYMEFNPEGIFKIQNVADYIESTMQGINIAKFYKKNCFLKFPFEVNFFEYYFKYNYIQHIAVTVLDTNIDNAIRGSNEENQEYLKSKKHLGASNTVYMEFFISDLSKRDIIFLGSLQFFANKYGDIQEKHRCNVGKSIKEEDKQYCKELIYDFSLPIFLSASFINCKNVILKENFFDTKLIKARQKKDKPYFEKYYTIQIEPMKEIIKNKENNHESKIEHALHICRGHFKTYDERPLFGKYKGKFWVESHVRGDPSIGKIKKDYEIVV